MPMTPAQKIAEAMPDASWLESDEPEMESSLHYEQLALLVKTLDWMWRDRQDYFIGANLTVYYSREQLKTRDFRGPDFFLVKNTVKKPRASWVTWEEGGKYPDLIIELLSDSTAEVDRQIKKELYHERFRTAEYFWFSPDTLEFEGFSFGIEAYEPIQPNEHGWRWSKVLGLYLGVDKGQLRYITKEGRFVPTPEEDAELAMMNAEDEAQKAARALQLAATEKARAESEKARAEALAAKLRELGIDPDSVL
jgi:Uma2 family endonuclease